MGAGGKRVGASQGPFQFTAKAEPGEQVTLTTEELYSMSQDQLLDLAQHVVLAPGVVLSPDADKRQVICRLIQSAVEIQ